MNATAEEVLKELNTSIGGVPPGYIMTVWDRVEPLLKRVVKPETGYAMEHVLNELQMAKLQLWVIEDFLAVVVTCIQERPLHRVLWVQFMAGDRMDEWLDDWITVQEEYARHNGCIAVEFSGRAGWHKKIHRQNQHRAYKPVLTTFRKEL